MAFLGLDGGETAVGGLVGGEGYAGSGGYGCAHHEAAASGFGCGCGSFGFAAYAVTDSSLAAVVDAVHAHDAARVIDPVFFSVDTRCFAVPATRTARVAFVEVDDGFEQRETR